MPNIFFTPKSPKGDFPAIPAVYVVNKEAEITLIR